MLAAKPLIEFPRRGMPPALPHTIPEAAPCLPVESLRRTIRQPGVQGSACKTLAQKTQLFSSTRTQSVAPLLFASGVMKV